ncbi:MAG TPA: SUMF1/EgtB/PvdO family nonheme iron enzyme [Fimbriimonadales bacterium]|nr:SUMF1/EgtB/PvdO family nonheme iron enzyme [Fimbriimonadales bacterium]
MHITALFIFLNLTPQQASLDIFEEKIPSTLSSFRMRRVPDGEITINKKKYSIKNIYFSETEITWDVYDIWLYRLDLTAEERAKGIDAESRPSKPYGAPDRGFGHSGYPAISMTYDAAEQFCAWLSKKTNKHYRLPTEFEWEYAARAGEKSSSMSNLLDYAWVWENSMSKTHPVGKKKPNNWGFFDMLGNAAEWAKDVDGKPVLCGGSFLDKQTNIGFSTRAYQTPKWNQTDPQNPKSKWWLSDAPFAGFRIVCQDK